MKNISVLVIFTTLALASVSGLSIRFKEEEVKNDQITATDSLLVSEINFGSEEKPQPVNTVFDVSESNIWVIESQECKDCVDDENLFNCTVDQTCRLTSEFGKQAYGLGGQVKFTGNNKQSSVWQEATNNVYVGGTEFKDLELQFPRAVAPQAKVPKQDFLKVAQASIGIGSGKDTEFTHRIGSGDNVSAKVAERAYSLYYGNIKKGIFGAPDDFFRSGEWKTLRTSQESNLQFLSNSFIVGAPEIQVGEQKISLQGTNAQKEAVNTYGVFSTTTKYIYFQNADQLAQLVKAINTAAQNSNCVLNKSQNFYGCDNSDNFPTVTITLSDKNNKHSFELTPKQYLHEVESNGKTSQVLLFRSGTYGAQNAVTKDIQGGNNNLIWLGYALYDRYYVSFNYDDNTVALAEKYEFTPQQETINSSNRLLLIIFGALIAIVATAVLLFTMKEVPYYPESFKYQYNIPATNEHDVKVTSPGRITNVVKSSIDTQNYSPKINQASFVPIPAYQVPTYQQSAIRNSQVAGSGVYQQPQTFQQ